VGGIGIAPGGNINYVTGHAVFEATHGTAPEVRGPGQGEPRERHPLRRHDVPAPRLDRGGDLIVKGMNGAIGARTVTYDFARQMKGDGGGEVKELKCSEFGQAIIQKM
jgi:isocitrate dehydrogenase